VSSAVWSGVAETTSTKYSMRLTTSQPTHSSLHSSQCSSGWDTRSMGAGKLGLAGTSADCDYSLLWAVGLGIYTSCVAKDLACTPRPFSPPVTRLCE